MLMPAPNQTAFSAAPTNRFLVMGECLCPGCLKVKISSEVSLPVKDKFFV